MTSHPNLLTSNLPPHPTRMTSLRSFLSGAAFRERCQTLDVVPVHLASWILICRRGFDLAFHGQPFLALQLVVNPSTGKFYVTVFARVMIILQQNVHNINPTTFFR